MSADDQVTQERNKDISIYGIDLIFPGILQLNTTVVNVIEM